MSHTPLEDIFKKPENNFDVENPATGHETRFLNKLKNQNEQPLEIAHVKSNFWKPFVGIAASVALIIALFVGTQQPRNSRDLASVSPEMANTQDFFTASIHEELQKLNKESLPEAQNLIQDALKQIKILETNYETLKVDLIESGDDSRVIYAMISNFQNRIDILQNTLEQIENIKQLKKSSHRVISESNI
ncbi:hypothetical protein GCM10023311_01300 [Flaviramulus aquimarinus]|uniref:DUF4179 domain-containing protein n=1 Tax=Flaviramulus aquimarinus TaxID=1170456 RepID=A0ABP9EWQ8_9FLAO